ncbi:MAG TPA: hypothetical protein VIC84_12345 [Blastocatellia bacterium]
MSRKLTGEPLRVAGLKRQRFGLIVGQHGVGNIVINDPRVGKPVLFSNLRWNQIQQCLLAESALEAMRTQGHVHRAAKI